MRRLFPIATVLFALAAPAYAQPHVGVRAGVSADPDQFYFGAHVESDPLLENLTFRPNVEVGLGDGATLLAFNIEFAYWIPITNQPWRFYLGGGPSANLYSFDDGGRGNGDGDTEFGGGFNILVGLQHTRGLFTEVKVGAIDSPSIKFAVGFAFR
jgi:hypothetical protein